MKGGIIIDKIFMYNNRDGALALYYTFSTDYGNTWNKATRLSGCVGYVMINKVPYYAMGAHIMLVVDSYIHIVFYDDRTGVNEIYYKRGRISCQ